jgi:L-lactate utilization protein LutC
MEQGAFLLKVRASLSRYSTAEEAKVLSSSQRPEPGPSASLEEKIERFLAECGELNNVQVFRVKDWAEAREKVGEMLTQKEVSSIAVAGKDLEPKGSFWKKWNPVQGIVSVERADVGVVQADYGLAETGSVVLVASPEKPRIVSLLPPVCFFVLPVSGMLDSMAHLMAELETRHEKGQMPATVNVVTGPSRTADIELSLTVGVHGPGEVQVILVG